MHGNSNIKKKKITVLTDYYRKCPFFTLISFNCAWRNEVSNPKARISAWAINLHQLIDKFPVFYGIGYLIAMWVLFYRTQVLSKTFYSVFLKFILILSFYLRRGLFPSVFPTKILHAFPFPLLRTSRTTHLILFDLIIQKIFGEYTNNKALIKNCWFLL